MYEMLPRDGMEQLTQGLREQLQTMTAAVHALVPQLAGDEKGTEYLSVLDRAICAQLRLILQAELGRLLYSEDERRIDLAPLDLVALGRDVMARAGALTRPLLDIRAEFSTDLTVLPTQADKAALEQLLLALLSNAVEAVGRGGSIRLELERQRDQAVFTMTDTGCGLDAGALSALFGPEPEDDEAGELAPFRGLRLAQRIALLHGGTLVAGNTEAGGARLAVSLPILSEKPLGILHSPALQVDSGGWDSVLVALSGSLPAAAFLPDREDL